MEAASSEAPEQVESSNDAPVDEVEPEESPCREKEDCSTPEETISLEDSVVNEHDEASSGSSICEVAEENAPLDEDSESSELKNDIALAILGITSMDSMEELDCEVVKVSFEDGPIGLHLESTSQERACRVSGFTEPEETNPACASQEIKVGMVIVSVNDIVCESFQHTMELLQAGGHREIAFRPTVASDDAYDEE